MSNRYNSGFREPPWVMGSPKEVKDWMDATHPSEEIERERLEEKKYLKNLHIKFDLDVEKKEIEDTSLISKILGKKLIEEDFDIFYVLEFVLRGLAKAKFKNIVKIKADDAILYKHPEKKSDLRNTIENITEFEDKIKNKRMVQVDSILDDVHICTATITIKKIHYADDHSVDIQIKGMIKKYIYHTFLNYLKEKMDLHSSDKK